MENKQYLGPIQRQVLSSLKQHGYWYPGYGCGWTWDTPSNTRKIMESLVKKGYAKTGTLTLEDGTKYHGAFFPIKNEEEASPKKAHELTDKPKNQFKQNYEGYHIVHGRKGGPQEYYELKIKALNINLVAQKNHIDEWITYILQPGAGGAVRTVEFFEDPKEARRSLLTLAHGITQYLTM